MIGEGLSSRTRAVDNALVDRRVVRLTLRTRVDDNDGGASGSDGGGGGWVVVEEAPPPMTRL